MKKISYVVTLAAAVIFAGSQIAISQTNQPCPVNKPCPCQKVTKPCPQKTTTTPCTCQKKIAKKIHKTECKHKV